jgi:hypothetical protein
MQDIPNDFKGIIYKITCIINNKKYIGQTLTHVIKNKKFIKTGINERINRHLNIVKSKKDNHKEDTLYYDINKYSLTNFTIEEIETVTASNLNELNNKEKFYITKYNTLYPFGYNKTLNTETVNVTKKYIYSLYNLKIERTNEYTKRLNRRTQQNIKIKEINSFYINKILIKITINPIKYDNVYSYVKVIIEDTDKYIYCIKFYDKDFSNCIKKSLDYINLLPCKNIIYHPYIKEYLKEHNINTSFYKYENKLHDIINNNYKRVYGNYTFHKSHNNYTYLLIFYKDNFNKRIMFGGKNINKEKAKDEALEFIEKLKNNNMEICIK